MTFSKKFYAFSDDFDQTVMILLNAIYFRGQWSEQFPKNQTTKAGFYLSNSKTVTVDYMQNTGKYLYHESNKLDAKVLRLPYRVSCGLNCVET